MHQPSGGKRRGPRLAVSLDTYVIVLYVKAAVLPIEDDPSRLN